MQPKNPELPVIPNVIAPLAEWWRRHAIARQNLAGLDAFDPDDMALMAHDVGFRQPIFARSRPTAATPPICSTAASKLAD